ncbi:MAG: hypothetical protein MUP36_02465 [Demequinaceae bacterium]|nr:hypothetical protein [Demequinaceae bacterium]
MLRMVLPYGALAFLGILVGVVGTGGHRFEPYWGSACVLCLVLAAGVFARAWKSWTGLLVFAQAWIAVVLLLYYTRGPGESIVILGYTFGKIWIFGGSIAVVAPAFIPRRLVSDGTYDGR